MDDSLAGLQLLQKCKGLRKFANALPCLLEGNLISFFLKFSNQICIWTKFSSHATCFWMETFSSGPSGCCNFRDVLSSPFSRLLRLEQNLSACLQLQLFLKKKLSLFSSSPLKTACILQNETSPHEMGIFRLSF